MNPLSHYLNPTSHRSVWFKLFDFFVSDFEILRITYQNPSKNFSIRRVSNRSSTRRRRYWLRFFKSPTHFFLLPTRFFQSPTEIIQEPTKTGIWPYPTEIRLNGDALATECRQAIKTDLDTSPVRRRWY